MKKEAGFTLIELMVTIGIIGVLAYLSLTSYYVYKDSAGYASAESMLRNARAAAAAGTSDPDNLPPPVPLVTQNRPGPLTDPNAYLYLPALQLPRKLKLQASFDPACSDPMCTAEFIRADSCFSKEYTAWTRFGDGLEIHLEKVGGASCN